VELELMEKVDEVCTIKELYTPRSGQSISGWHFTQQLLKRRKHKCKRKRKHKSPYFTVKTAQRKRKHKGSKCFLFIVLALVFAFTLC
jgi:hypothetical protein